MNKRLWLPLHGPRQEQCWLVLRSNRQPEMNALKAAAQNTEISICDLASCMCCYEQLQDHNAEASKCISCLIEGGGGGGVPESR